VRTVDTLETAEVEEEKFAGMNIEKDPIEVKHADLERDDPTTFRSICPACKAGTLAGRRDPETFEILSEDNCILCGQRFIYTDLGKEGESCSEKECTSGPTTTPGPTK
jgi:hypothetical protein